MLSTHRRPGKQYNTPNGPAAAQYLKPTSFSRRVSATEALPNLTAKGMNQASECTSDRRMTPLARPACRNRVPGGAESSSMPLAAPDEEGVSSSSSDSGGEFAIWVPFTCVAAGACHAVSHPDLMRQMGAWHWTLRGPVRAFGPLRLLTACVKATGFENRFQSSPTCPGLRI